MTLFLNFVLRFVACCIGVAWAVPLVRRASHLDNAKTAFDVLQETYYDPTNGLWGNNGWTSANQMTTIAKLAQVDPSVAEKVKEVIANTVKLQSRDGFLNGFYDDEGWWALSLIAAYDFAGVTKYLDFARAIFDDMIGGFDTSNTKNRCGGIWWDKDHSQLGAIANSLLFSVAAHLSNRQPITPDQSERYKQIAAGQRKWFSDVNLVNNDNLVNDQVNFNKEPMCVADTGSTTWTYNQGVLIGALAELYRNEKQADVLDEAHRLATATMQKLVDTDGILTEQRSVDQLDPTAAQFKGVFARNLLLLHDVSPRREYAEFLQKNADSIWSAGRDESTGRLGPMWQGPFKEERAAASAHGSALDGLVAAAAVDTASESAPCT